MTDHAQLVAIEIAEVCTVVVGVIVRAQARQTFIGTTLIDSELVHAIDRCAVFCHEGNHLTIAGGVGFTIKRTANDEQRAPASSLLPSGPGVLRIEESLPQFKRLHQRRVEGMGTAKVGYADEDVGEHDGLTVECGAERPT
jgi:hypothetical protein